MVSRAVGGMPRKAVKRMDRDVQTTKAAPLRPTGPPAAMVKPGRCPIVGFLVHVSPSRPKDRHPPLILLPEVNFKRRFSSSSSSEEFHFRRRYHTYRHHGLQQRPDPCRAPDCRMDGNCHGELKCCAVSGCGMRCLRPLPSDQLPGDMQRFQL
ncbi:UNVERIFIED_CONTAM: hypothetical protein K2H54_025773 [Gekko kuhli]